MAIILLFSVAMFIIFNYIPSMLNLSALESDRRNLLILENKIRDLEKIMFQEKVAYTNVKTIQKKSKKVAPPEIKTENKIENKAKGNRGYLIRGGKSI